MLPLASAHRAVGPFTCEHRDFERQAKGHGSSTRRLRHRDRPDAGTSGGCRVTHGCAEGGNETEAPPVQKDRTHAEDTHRTDRNGERKPDGDARE
jgi:hypothetical protein